MATSGGLFGSTTAAAPAATGGLFGSAPAAPAASGSLFGAPAQPAAPAAGGLFGSTAAAPAQNSLFGKPAAIAGGLFGSAAPAQQPTGFGAPQLGASTLAASTLNAPKQEENIETRIVAIKNGWDLNSPECRFKYFFYNVVDEGTTQFYGRPAGATDDAKWARAVRDNPDPMTWVTLLNRSMLTDQDGSGSRYGVGRRA
jgi:nuclear pore complex protein Nup54